MSTPNDSRSPSVTGWCYAYFAYDIGLSVDLDKAGARLRDAGQRLKLPVQRRRGASWLGYEPPPLRVTLKPGPVGFGRYETDSTVECTVFDFGGVSIRYRVPIRATLDELPRLSDALYENWPLLEDSRRRVEELLAAFGGAIIRPGIAPLVEDYAVFAIEQFEGAGSLDDLLAHNGPALARILRAETGPLSEQQVRESLAERVSFSTSDAVLASWEGAVVLDPEPTDVLTVLEHVNVELVELRLLDNRLDALLDEAYAYMQRQSERSLWPRGRGSSGLRGIAAAQIDAAMLFESVNNAIKLVGDQHLARVYSLAAARLHLTEWDGAILRKLDTAESIYQKLTQFETGRRMEVLEIVIVILIALSIVLTFVPGGGH